MSQLSMWSLAAAVLTGLIAYGINRFRKSRKFPMAHPQGKRSQKQKANRAFDLFAALAIGFFTILVATLPN